MDLLNNALEDAQGALSKKHVALRGSFPKNVSICGSSFGFCFSISSNGGPLLALNLPKTSLMIFCVFVIFCSLLPIPVFSNSMMQVFQNCFPSRSGH